MTDLRTAAQQALEALGLWATGCDMDAVALNDLIHHLQTALAEPVQEPLTREEIMDLCASQWAAHPVEVARLIERAHGIGDNT